MREDARRLLSILGEKDFRYHEFDDRFADLGSWPLFDDLIAKPQLNFASGASAVLPPTQADVVVSAPPVGDARSILGQLAEMAAAGTL